MNAEMYVFSFIKENDCMRCVILVSKENDCMRCVTLVSKENDCMSCLTLATELFLFEDFEMISSG